LKVALKWMFLLPIYGKWQMEKPHLIIRMLIYFSEKHTGARKVDESLGSSYKPYNLGAVVSTTIFMMSFSGRGEKGSSIREIKLSTVYPEFSSTVIDTVISNLKEKLFYISDEGFNKSTHFQIT